ncbi:MAG: hypothetical protein ABIS03_13835 [Gemmatimonadaceae bacterium]
MRFRLAVLAVIGFTACSGDKQKAVDSSAVAPAAAVQVAPVQRAVTSDPCEHSGLWSPCTVDKRLRQAGFVITREVSDTLKRAGFSVKPVVFMLSQARLELFFYDNAAARAKDVAGIDTLTATPPGTPSPWKSTPVFIQSVNLAAVLVGANPRQAERVMNALTAGAPQPGSPR